MTRVETILREFVFWDCRLGSHPRVIASVRFRDGDSLRLVAYTGHQEIPPSLSVANKQGGLTGHLLAEDGNRKARIYIKAILGVPIRGRSEAEVAGVISIRTSHDIEFDDRRLGEATTLAAMLSYVEFHLNKREVRPTEFSRELGKALRHIPEDLALSQQELAQRARTTRIALSQWEAGTQPPTYGPFQRWCGALGLLSPDTPTIVTLSDVTPQLLRILSAQPDRLRELSPEGFEVLVAERLDKAGFEVQRTGSTSARDGGIDLIAVPRLVGIASHLIAVQIKHHREMYKTGREAVDRLLSWRGSLFNADLLVTNTAFTRDALWAASQEAARHFLRLRDLEDLRRWMQGTFWSEKEWRELPEEVELAPGVTIVRRGA